MYVRGVDENGGGWGVEVRARGKKRKRGIGLGMWIGFGFGWGWRLVDAKSNREVMGRWDDGMIQCMLEIMEGIARIQTTFGLEFGGMGFVAGEVKVRWDEVGCDLRD